MPLWPVSVNVCDCLINKNIDQNVLAHTRNQAITRIHEANASVGKRATEGERKREVERERERGNAKKY